MPGWNGYRLTAQRTPLTPSRRRRQILQFSGLYAAVRLHFVPASVVIWRTHMAPSATGPPLGAPSTWGSNGPS